MTFATTSFCASSAKRTFTTTSQNVRGPTPLRNSCCRFMVSRSPVFDIYDAFHLVASSDVVTTTIPSATAAATSFEPQLNVPAFGVFLLILVVFSFLQFRISRIGEAADRRTEALEELRSIKSKELSGQLTDPNAVDRALQAYKEAVEQVESLRTIVPGVRIAPPPASQSLTRQRMDENVAAAKQFLGMDLVDPSSSSSPTDEGIRNESPAGLSPGLVALLALVVVMQIGLLGLLSVDPMSGMDFMDTVDTLSGLE